MNTQKSKVPKRYKPIPFQIPDGTYTSGIANEKIALAVSSFITQWPHIEELFIPLFAELLCIDDLASARLVFRSIVSQDARLKIMESMLEKSPAHKDKTLHFEELISEYRSLNQCRNNYVHGLWRTRNNGDVYLETELRTPFSFDKADQIEEHQVQGALVRMRDLVQKLLERRRTFGLARALSRRGDKARPRSADDR